MNAERPVSAVEQRIAIENREKAAIAEGGRRHAAAVPEPRVRPEEDLAFPDQAGAPQYNTADATLWMFEAVERLAEGTGSLVTARGLFPLLSDIIAIHQAGP